jgi:anti-sigma factor RsiW
MSRDRRDRPESNDPAARPGDAAGACPPTLADPERSGELLTAYVDGVAELPVDERRAVERWLAADPSARADADAVHDLLGRLRALPPTYDTGEPPDWAAMERSIRQAVADEPAMTCATAAAIAIALWPRPAMVGEPAPRPVHDRGSPGHEPPSGDERFALWLDGSEVDVDLSPPGAVDDALDATLGIADGSAPRADELDAAAGPDDEIGVLPASGMAWVDDLDDDALDRAERLLAHPPGTTGPAPTGRSRSKG